MTTATEITITENGIIINTAVGDYRTSQALCTAAAIYLDDPAAAPAPRYAPVSYAGREAALASFTRSRMPKDEQPERIAWAIGLACAQMLPERITAYPRDIEDTARSAAVFWRQWTRCGDSACAKSIDRAVRDAMTSQSAR